MTCLGCRPPRHWRWARATAGILAFAIAESVRRLFPPALWSDVAPVVSQQQPPLLRVMVVVVVVVLEPLVEVR